MPSRLASMDFWEINAKILSQMEDTNGYVNRIVKYKPRFEITDCLSKTVKKGR